MRIILVLPFAAWLMNGSAAAQVFDGPPFGDPNLMIQHLQEQAKVRQAELEALKSRNAMEMQAILYRCATTEAYFKDIRGEGHVRIVRTAWWYRMEIATSGRNHGKSVPRAWATLADQEFVRDQINAIKADPEKRGAAACSTKVER